MQKNQLKTALAELYSLDPSLKEYETDLVKLILKLEDVKPETKFDSAFAARLKAELLSRTNINYAPVNKNLFNFNFMNKKIYIAAGSLAVIGLWLFIFSGNFKSSDNLNRGTLAIKQNQQATPGKITKLAAGAFSNLSATDYTIAGNELALDSSGKGKTATTQSRVASMVPAMSPAPMAVNAGGENSTSVAVGGGINSKMFMPQYSFKYVYKGEPLDLKETSGDVYRRLKGDSQIGQELAGLIGQANFSDLDIKSFTNFKPTSLSLAENKDQGLMVNFDFIEDAIYISENWTKWQMPEREACGDSQACWDSFRVKISDIPSDADTLALANKFLNEHKINLEHYGAPQVDNSWRESYEKMEDKSNFYFSESLSVIYPLQLNGESVLDQSGNYAGLRVNINLLKKAASGLNGLTPYRYESSSYELETNSDNIIKVAESGGWNHIYYATSGAEKIETVELGTPVKAYVQTWRYANGRSDELIIPALVFPVIKAPANPFYYGGKYIIVPLAKDLIKEINNQPVPLIRALESGPSGGGAMPTGTAGVSANSELILKR